MRNPDRFVNDVCVAGHGLINAKGEYDFDTLVVPVLSRIWMAEIVELDEYIHPRDDISSVSLTAIDALSNAGLDFQPLVEFGHPTG